MRTFAAFGIRLWLCSLLVACFSVNAFGQNPARAQAPPSRGSAEQSGEQRTARALETAKSNPLDLHAFLVEMPKGTDLHNHLGGAIYAETWIRTAAEDGLCVDPAKKMLMRPEGAILGSPASGPRCGTGSIPAASAFSDQHLYDALIDAFSMRAFVPTPGTDGHDQFFDTFDRFGADDTSTTHLGEYIDEIATRAAAQNEQYIELMHTPPFGHAVRIARELGWRDDMGRLRDDLLARGLRDEVAMAHEMFDQAEKARSQRERCGQADEKPSCRVQIRYIYQVLRGLPKQVVFAQTLLGFETASADPRIVGLNYVMPEDGFTSMNDYALHMQIVGFLHSLYPKVHITLHAGELAPGLVPPDGLCCHIHMAVDVAHAERIGHGVDVMYEDHPYDLLKELAQKHVMVEINLTSNDVILGISGKEHPFPIYRRFGVPVSLSTDDEGVSRIDMTHEYVRAVETYGLHYADLKQMVRTGMEHSFLPGDSLWSDPDLFKKPVSACGVGELGADKPSATCEGLLQKSEKATQQWELEKRFRAFEATH
jgi:adenosine deaminase